MCTSGAFSLSGLNFDHVYQVPLYIPGSPLGHHHAASGTDRRHPLQRKVGRARFTWWELGQETQGSSRCAACKSCRLRKLSCMTGTLAHAKSNLACFDCSTAYIEHGLLLSGSCQAPSIIGLSKRDLGAVAPCISFIVMHRAVNEWNTTVCPHGHRGIFWI